MSYKLKRGLCSDNGINPRAVYEFVKTAEEKQLGIDSFMLIKNNVVVAEGYHRPYSNSSTHVLYSFSKSITAIALGFAIDEGLLSIDDSITKFFPEYDKIGLNKKITVRHLVTMTAGKMIGMAKKRTGKDWIKIFFNAPLIMKPGKTFMYVNDNFYLLSAIISKLSGETLVDYLYPRLFEPLGIKKPVWETDKFGYAAGGWGLYMNIEDLSKIMICYSKMGEIDGRQIIPKWWIDESTKFQVETVKRGHIDVRQGYGFGFWRSSLPNTYRAYGLHGQFGYVFEGRDTVLITNSGISKDEYLTDAINEMYKTLWEKPETEYEEKLNEILVSFGDKDFLLERERNFTLESKYNGIPLKTNSTIFATMISPTMSAVMEGYGEIGHISEFSLITKDDKLFLKWKENKMTNEMLLGMKNEYEKSTIELGGITYTACTKAAWTKDKVLTILVRMEQCCHVRRLEFDFSDESKIIIRNDSFPDLPTLAAHYMDFSGMPLPKWLEDLLIKYVAPAVLLIGEPNFKIKN